MLLKIKNNRKEVTYDKNYLEIKKFTLKILIAAQAFSLFILMAFFNPYSNFFDDNFSKLFVSFDISYCFLSSIAISACAIFFFINRKIFKLKHLNYLIFFNILIIIYSIIELFCKASSLSDTEYLWEIPELYTSLFPILFIPPFYKYLQYFNENISNQYNFILLIITFFVTKAIIKTLLTITGSALIYTIYQFTDIICNLLYISFYNKSIKFINILTDKQKIMNTQQNDASINRIRP